jgi:hypothetical protein
MRQYAILLQYAHKFRLPIRLLAIYISKLFYSPLTSSNAAAASSIAAKALST